MQLQKNILVLFLLISLKINCQDIRGAYIRTAWVPATTFIYAYNYTVTLMTAPPSNNLRQSINLNFGDATAGILSLNSSSVVNGITVSTYTGSHTYGGPNPFLSYYLVSYVDSFRISNIRNIGNSQTQKLLVTSRIYANNISWTNSSCVVKNLTAKLIVANNKVILDPGVEEVDGDSLAYSLDNIITSTNYYKPNNITIDPGTGIISFFKDSIGLYAFYLRIQEWEKNTSGSYQIARVTQMDFILDINQTVGLENPRTSQQDVILYPNPVNDVLKINFGSFTNTNAKVTLIDALGRCIPINTDVDGDALQTDFLEAGIYFLYIENSKQRQTIKFVKL